MKHNDLRSVAHNIADSLASGIGLLIGVYEMNIFGEAVRSPERQITVDFLRGAAVERRVPQPLRKALVLYRDALPSLCERQGVSVDAFRVLTARYYVAGIHGRRFIVTVEDQLGRRSIDEYQANPGRRPVVLDHLGRRRRKPGIRTAAKRPK